MEQKLQSANVTSLRNTLYMESLTLFAEPWLLAPADPGSRPKLLDCEHCIRLSNATYLIHTLVL